MHAFAARRLGAEAARAIVAPFVTGVYAADAHDVSLEAGFPRLAALDAKGGLVRGMLSAAVVGAVSRLRGKKRAATPRGMWAPRGGLGTLIAALAASLGDRIELGDPVERIEPVAGGVMIDDERWDAAVLAIPAADALPLVDAMPTLATRLAVFARSPVALVYLGYPAEAVPGARDGFGFLVAQGEELRALGVVFESTVWPDRAPTGQVLLRCIFGGSRDPAATEPRRRRADRARDARCRACRRCARPTAARERGALAARARAVPGGPSRSRAGRDGRRARLPHRARRRRLSRPGGERPVRRRERDRA